MNNNLIGFWSCTIMANTCFASSLQFFGILGFGWVGMALWFWYSEKNIIKRRRK